MKKMNKKGFTLVEIIITLALVISITVVAVGSYIGVSNNKKKEEWELVKKQIETAAEQYISTNKYMYEDLNSGNDISAYISVGTLVKTDYLNKVVDPETKKELDKCVLVEVKISNGGKYNATYIGKKDNDTDCSNENKSITFKEAEAADIEVNISKLDNTHDNIGNWYDTGVKYTLNIKTRKKSVTNVKYCIGDSNCSPDKDISSDYSVEYKAPSGTNEKNKYACFMVTVMSGGTAKRSKACKFADIDNSNPTCTAKFTNANSYGWTNTIAIVKPNSCSDTGGVGCSSISGIENRYSKETSGTDVSVKVKDRFDHEGSCSATVKVDATAPSIKYIVQPKAKKCGGQKGVYIKYEVSDNLSGVKETYHYYGKDTGAKDYSTIAGYDMKVVNNTKAEILGPITVERTWAVGNPSGCASENKNGPNTSWCYYNNTAVKDYAGNTKTAISSSCSKIGG